MKKPLSTLATVLLFVVHSIAATQRLIVPKLNNIQVKADGSLTLVAYCLDKTRIWPDYSKPLGNLYFGGDATTVTMRINGKTQKLKLSEAIEKQYLEVRSGVRSVVLVSKNKNCRILSLSTEGFAAGEQAEPFELANTTRLQMPSNNNPKDWQKIQDKVHQAQLRQSNTNPNSREMVLKEYAKGHIEKKYGLIKRSSDWEVEVKNDLITINDRTKTYDDKSAAFNGLYHDLLKELEDMEVCLKLPADSQLTVKVTGSLKGAFPVKIEFTSDQKLTATADVFKAPVKIRDKEIKAVITVSDETMAALFRGESEKAKGCKLEIEGEICLPAKASTVTVKACDIGISLGAEGIQFAF